MPHPPGKLQTFRRYRTNVAKSGINVPQIYAEDLSQGFLLLNDLGKNTYLDVIDGENADQIICRGHRRVAGFPAIADGRRVAQLRRAVVAPGVGVVPRMVRAPALGIEFDEQQAALWQRVSQLLIESALAQPKVLVHRDYMPRNLMISVPNPGVLDFQDAVYGPVTYDITCLFKDAFLSWPQARVREWQRGYWERAGQLGIPVQADVEDFLRASDLMGCSVTSR
ncbi:phosphotransferase [Pseudomonas proteolytica]|uniref:phosphotransferase n=1 Tax=Pseudomonas proteolytica TaxID=219574 RepID=UPI000B88D29C|nr:phosphotransferase [Pseudomonas proteolytica]